MAWKLFVMGFDREPYRFRCFLNGVPFLKRQLGKTMLHCSSSKLSRAAQLWVWRVPRKPQFWFENYKTEQFNVKVLLAELADKEHLLVTSPEGFAIAQLHKSEKAFTLYGTQLRIELRGNRVLINRKQYPMPLCIDSVGQTLRFNEAEYKGTLLLVQENDTLLVINKLALEDYVYSVLRSESWPGWPLEVNKAFAIASRSYAMAKVLENMNKKNKKQYHFKNTNIHQTYKGHHCNEKLLQAVHETEGVIVAYDKKPILAMFDCCCGGIIPAKIADVDFSKAPYLQRWQVCNFCESSKIYRWNLDINMHDFIKILAGAGYKTPIIKDITLSHDDAGCVKDVAIHGLKPGQELVISGKQFYSLIKKVKSFCYVVKKRPHGLEIQGKGYGHHLGLCQWGARRMIDHGYTYRDILRFYYPQTDFMKIALTT